MLKEIKIHIESKWLRTRNIIYVGGGDVKMALDPTIAKEKTTTQVHHITTKIMV